MNSQPMNPQDSHLHSLSVVAFAHAVHASKFHRASDQMIIAYHQGKVVEIAERIEAELRAQA